MTNLNSKYAWPLQVDKLVKEVQRVFYSLIDPKHSIYDVLYVLKTNKRIFFRLTFQPKDKGLLEGEIFVVTPNGVRTVFRTSGFNVSRQVIERIVRKFKGKKQLSSKDIEEIYNELVKAKIIPPLDPAKFKSLVMRLKAIGLVKDAKLSNENNPLSLKLLAFAESIFAIFAVIALLRLVRSYLLKIEEATAQSELERQLEERFRHFIAPPEVLKEYSAVISLVDDIALDHKPNGAIICGPPGMGKTFIVLYELYRLKRLYGIDYVILKGAVDNELSFFATLYKHKNDLIVFDDFDVKWTEELVGLLKAALDSYPKRIISFPAEKLYSSAGQSSELREIPRQFIFTGQIIIITNKTKDELPPAIRSRVPIVEVNFNAKTLIKLLRANLKNFAPNVKMEIKQEVLDYLLKLYNQGKLKHIDFRTFELALTLRLLHQKNWKEMVEKVLS